ncbi:MAG: sulfotransferase [Actinobacteria bacterium]|nr:MAG: sulfotransferase [Actinomycetota bacterium]RIK03810.1 MAG: hypothetical protein DCC48_15490 [Acidobacteriota bacterium]
MSEVSFDLDQLLREAIEATGLSDFGSDDFSEGLQVLLETYDHNGFDEDGRRHSRGRLLGLLQERLRIEHAWKTHPEVREVQIVAPMYLTGLPRTGTSALLNLLAQDPAMRPLELWEAMNPSPLPGNPPKADDPRYQVIKEFTDRMYEQNPGFEAIHHTGPDTPEECIHLLNHTFADVQFGIECLLEPYGSWFQAQDHRASYTYYADILRLLQWSRPGERFLLKSPAHLWALDILVEMFPDCSIVITHRDPVECVASYASMMEAMMSERRFDRHDLGPAVMEYLARKTEYSLACRDSLDPARILDVYYRDAVSEPLATVARIYAYFGLPLDADLEHTFADHSGSHRQGEHGTHAYRLEDYGLTEETIGERFLAYTDRFPGL